MTYTEKYQQCVGGRVPMCIRQLDEIIEARKKQETLERLCLSTVRIELRNRGVNPDEIKEIIGG